MLYAAIGFVVGVCVVAAAHHIGRPPPPEVEIDPLVRHWAMEEMDQRLIAAHRGKGNHTEVQAIGRHLRLLKLLAYAQGWHGDSVRAHQQEEVNRQCARWN